MTSALQGTRIGFIERRHPPGHRGSLMEHLIPLLVAHGAAVDLVCAEDGMHRLDINPGWDVAVLKSGSAAALHVAAAAEAWGIPCVNRSEATRLTQDKLASTAILQRAALPVPPSRLAWWDPEALRAPDGAAHLAALADRRLIVKAGRGSRGAGLWTVEPGGLATMAAELPAGPYLIMDWIPHQGDDLKVFVAGDWTAAIERPFPATTLAAKQGRPVPIPDAVVNVTRAVGRLLGLTCFGCDYVDGPSGWTLVDVNAFPGYKGAPAAADAIVREVGRVATGGARS